MEGNGNNCVIIVFLKQLKDVTGITIIPKRVIKIPGDKRSSGEQKDRVVPNTKDKKGSEVEEPVDCRTNGAGALRNISQFSNSHRFLLISKRLSST